MCVCVCICVHVRVCIHVCIFNEFFLSMLTTGPNAIFCSLVVIRDYEGEVSIKGMIIVTV